MWPPANGQLENDLRAYHNNTCVKRILIIRCVMGYFSIIMCVILLQQCIQCEHDKVGQRTYTKVTTSTRALFVAFAIAVMLQKAAILAANLFSHLEIPSWARRDKSRKFNNPCSRCTLKRSTATNDHRCDRRWTEVFAWYRKWQRLTNAITHCLAKDMLTI